MSAELLQIRDLHVEVAADATGDSAGKEILKGVSIEIKAGEIHCLMGRNGSGKSTLSSVIMGHPSYRVTGGSIRFGGDEMDELMDDMSDEDPDDLDALFE